MSYTRYLLLLSWIPGALIAREECRRKLPIYLTVANNAYCIFF
jgi:hypothetical protein